MYYTKTDGEILEQKRKHESDYSSSRNGFALSIPISLMHFKKEQPKNWEKFDSFSNILDFEAPMKYLQS